jgi:hypothetical protein
VSGEGSSPIAKLFGGLLMAAGVLIMGLCGLCSAAVLVSSLVSSSGAFSGLAMIPLVGIVGGVPIALGAGMFIAGRLLWRGPRKPEPKAETFD